MGEWWWYRQLVEGTSGFAQDGWNSVGRYKPIITGTIGYLFQVSDTYALGLPFWKVSLLKYTVKSPSKFPFLLPFLSDTWNLSTVFHRKVGIGTAAKLDGD